MVGIISDCGGRQAFGSMGSKRSGNTHAPNTHAFFESLYCDNCYLAPINLDQFWTSKNRMFESTALFLTDSKDLTIQKMQSRRTNTGSYRDRFRSSWARLNRRGSKIKTYLLHR